MTGRSVVWTDEMRAALREKMRAVRSKETLEQKTSRVAKRNATIKSNPEKWEERNLKISITRKHKREALSEIAKLAHQNKSEESRNKSLSNLILEPAQREELNRTTANKRSANQKNINRKIAEGVEESWRSLSDQERADRQIKSLVAQAGDYPLIDGTYLKCHSSWEAPCANVLISTNTAFSPQKLFVLGNTNYFADFALDKLKIVVEVKGHPKAFARWKEETYPAILKYMDPSWAVFILDRKLKDEKFSNLLDFLNSCKKVFPLR